MSTVEERIIAHLRPYKYERYINKLEPAPYAITIDGVAEALDLTRAHANIALRRLEKKEILVKELKHIKGMAKRRRVYLLNPYPAKQSPSYTSESPLVPIKESDRKSVV